MRWLLGTRDDGFSIIESMIALSIVFMLILTLLRTFDTGVRVVSQTGRRAAATALASELLERARSLEWEHMGLTSNANDSACPGGVGCATHAATVTAEIGTNTAGNYTFDGEEIVFANGATFDPFLSFTDSVDRDGADFTRYLFVTSVRDDPDDVATERSRRITAVVQWESSTGLPQETRIATLVSEFTEPSQPYIHGEAEFEGGSFTIRGSESRCAGDLSCGAFAPSTFSWIDSTATRKDFQMDAIFADGFTSATSDYVSLATTRATGTAADIRFAGADGSLGTVDDDLTTWDQAQLTTVADDDASSLPPRNDVATAFESLSPAFDASQSPPGNIVAADLEATADLVTFLSADVDAAVTWREAWIDHDVDPGPDLIDGLPFSKLELKSAETTRVGFFEYIGSAVRSFYEAKLGGTLDDPWYEFTLIRHGDADSTSALTFEGRVDRFEDISKNRQSHVTARWTGEEINLLADTIQPLMPGRNDFEGWVHIDLPTFETTSPLQAGEAASLSPTLDVTSDLKVEFWDGDDAQYRTAFSDYDSMTCDTTETVGFSDVGSIGGPQVLSIAHSGAPLIRYEVDAEITVRRFCESYELDANGAVAGAYIQSGGFLTGTVTYKVVDELIEASTGDGVLFDLEIDFDAGGLDATALFFDPNA